jgi:hypothetical protein
MQQLAVHLFFIHTVCIIVRHVLLQEVLFYAAMSVRWQTLAFCVVTHQF